VTLERSLSSVSTSSSSSRQQQQQNQLGNSTSYRAQAWLKYDGRPPPPEPPVLVFKQGDFIQITDDDDDEWWKGFIVNANKLTREEGYFPRRHVKSTQSVSVTNLTMSATTSNATATTMINATPPLNVNLDECAWFAPVDRQTADSILSRIPNPEVQTLFMVRCRQEGGYAISIKYKGFLSIF
jgi:hypothetical protein